MIRDIIQGQKEDFEKKQTEAYVLRQSVIRSFESGLIQVVIGPRRAGKSMYSIHAIPEQYRIGYVNFDDEHLVEVKNFDSGMLPD